MKKLLILLVVIMALALSGCLTVPDETVESVIVCEGGYYAIHFAEWTLTGCEEDPIYPAGTYWCNADGKMFLIGEVVFSEDVLDVYGKCPSEFINEI